LGKSAAIWGASKLNNHKAPKKVRGYIVGREVDEKLQYAAKVVDSGVIGLQVFDLGGQKGKENWIQISKV
jgi:hypothetical protein